MKSSRLTLRYAKSLLGLAIERNLLEEVLLDMKKIKDIHNKNKDFKMLMQTPIVKTDKKTNILNRIFQSQLHDVSMKFINIITSKKREMYLESISENFINLYKSYKNLDSVTLITSYPIDEDLRKTVLDYIKKHINSNIELHERVDPKIIGGFILKTKDKELNSSILYSIKKLKQKFNQNLYIQDY